MKSLFIHIFMKNPEKKLLWDKVEISTAVPDEIEGFGAYREKLDANAASYLYLKEINYGEEGQPLIYVEEYIDTGIIRYNMIRQKDIDYSK